MRRLGWATIGLVIALAIQPMTGWGSWTVNNTGSGTATATTVQQLNAPVATLVGSTAVISWNQGFLAQGIPATGYVVRRTVGATTTTLCTPAAPTLTCTDSAPPTPGVAYYTVAATYFLWTGQQSNATAFISDSTPPVTTLASAPVPNGAGWNQTAPTLTLTATDVDSSVVSITYQIGAAAPVTVSAASTSFPVTAQGSTTVSYAATDLAGNVEATKTYTVKLDTVAPSAPTTVAISADTGSSTTDGVTKTVAQTLAGTAEANSTVELKLGAVVTATTTAGPGGAFSFPLGTLAGGSYSYTITAIDVADNRSTATAFTVKVDTSAPTLSGVFPANGGSYNNGQFKNGCVSPQDAVCGTVADPAYSGGLGTIGLKLANSAGNCLNSGGTFTAAACSIPLVPTGSTTWSRVVGTLVNGTYTLTVTATDLAGNVFIGTYAFSRS